MVILLIYFPYLYIYSQYFVKKKLKIYFKCFKTVNRSQFFKNFLTKVLFIVALPVFIK